MIKSEDWTVLSEVIQTKVKCKVHSHFGTYKVIDWPLIKDLQIVLTNSYAKQTIVHEESRVMIPISGQ